MSARVNNDIIVEAKGDTIDEIVERNLDQDDYGLVIPPRPKSKPKTEKRNIYHISITKVKLLTFVVKALLFTSVLACLVYSKLTVIQIFGELHLLSNFSSPIDDFILDDERSTPEEVAATLYWMLLFIVIVPNLITLFRSLGGVLSRSPQRPWPNRKALAMVSLIMALATI